MDLQSVFNKQKEFFNVGYSKSITFREMMLEKLYKTVKENEKALLKALSLDLGNSFLEGYTTELGMLYSSINKSRKSIHKWARRKKVKSAFYLPFSKAQVKSVPYGNVLIMSAFNYPILLSLDPLVGAIVAGNTAMLALPSSTPHVNKVLVEMLNKTFDEKYIYAFVTNRDLNSEILTYRYDKIFYTGSSHVGKIVATAAAKNLIPTTLELGGKSPAVITSSAKVSGIAKTILWGKMLNAGQTCVAPDYVLVSSVIVDDFILELNKSFDKMYGLDLENNPDFSKIVNEQEMQRLLDIIEADKTYIINDWNYNIEKRHLGLVMLKTTLNDVNNLESMKKELFGPILPIIVYNDLDDAINYINSKETPLAFYPFTTEKSEANYLLEEVRFGGATVNDTVLHLSNLALPFGGLGNSGMGNYHGKYSFDAFSHKQAVLKTKSSFKNTLVYPPYNGFKDKLIRLFLK